MKTAIITAGIIVLLLGTVNVNYVCARYNYNAYETGKLKTIDVDALYELGDEAIPYIVRLACSEDKVIAKIAQGYLDKAYRYDYFDNMSNVSGFNSEDLKQNREDKGFERFSIPKQRAYEYLYKFIDKNPEFSQKSQHSYFEY